MNTATLIVGSNGTGKTTFLKKRIVKAKGKVCQIIVSCSNEDYSDIADNVMYFNSDLNAFFDRKGKETEIITNKKYTTVILFEKSSFVANGAYRSFSQLCIKLSELHNCRLYVDDIRAVIDSKVSASLKSLFVIFRQNNVNLFVVYHSLNDVHKSLLTHFTYLVLFRTKDFYLKEHVKHLRSKKIAVDTLAENNPHAFIIFEL